MRRDIRIRNIEVSLERSKEHMTKLEKNKEKYASSPRDLLSVERHIKELSATIAKLQNSLQEAKSEKNEPEEKQNEKEKEKPFEPSSA